MEEANEEAEHKGWCDTELGTNEATRKEKTSAVETLHAEIDELNASIVLRACFTRRNPITLEVALKGVCRAW